MPEIKIAIEKVSPTAARNWLAVKGPNRGFNEARAKQYAADMEAGRWRLNGVPIAFNGDGTLIDGQHRLEAIIRCGTTQTMTVVRGVEQDAMATFDTGMGRKLKDFLRINGETYSVCISTMIRNIWRWDRYHTFAHSNYTQVQPTIQQELGFFEAHAEELRYAATMGVLNARKALLTDSLIGSLYIIFGGVNEDDADDFFERLASGSEMGERHPVMALRRRMIDNKAARDKMRSYIKAALVIKAWNAYREGQDIQNLSWRAGGKKPEPFPQPV